MCSTSSIHIPQAQGLPSLRTISQVPQNAYFATRGSALSLEYLCVIAPHTAVGLEAAFACHTDLGGLQQADAGYQERQERSCSFSTHYVTSLMPESLHASSHFIFTTTLTGSITIPSLPMG